MAVFTVFLRAINVSGKNIIRMEDLRKMVAKPGISNVATYIQSGNIVLESDETAPQALKADLQEHLAGQLGYTVELFVRTPAELEKMLRINPFNGKERDGVMQYITLLSAAPKEEHIAALKAFESATDSFEVIGRELYSLVVKDGSKSRMEPKFIEKKLGVLGTTRNLRTINKMLALSTETTTEKLK